MPSRAASSMSAYKSVPIRTVYLFSSRAFLAYGHGEFNNDKFTNLEYIKNRINSNKELFSDTDLEKVELDETFPKYLIHNKEKFKDFLI